MKFLLVIVSTLALASATTVDNKYDLHYTQHQSSVDSARNLMQERLSKLEMQQRQYSSGGSENYVAGCSSCAGGSSAGSTFNSRLSSSSSSGAQNSRISSGSALNSDYVGVGIVGHVNDGRSSSINSRFSNSAAYEQDDLQQRVVPGDLNGIHASAYRKEETEDEDDVQRTVGVGFRDGVVNNDRYSYSQRRHEQNEESRTSSSHISSHTTRVPVYYVPAGSSSTFRQATGSESDRYEERRGVVGGSQAVPIGSYVSMAVRPGTATVLQVPVGVSYVQRSGDQLASNSRTGYASEQESSNTQTRVQPGQRVVYYPAGYTSSSTAAERSRSEHESRVQQQQQPEKLTNPDFTSYNSYSNRDGSSQSRFNQEDSQVQERVSPNIDYSGRSENYITTTVPTVRGGGYTGVRVNAFPVNTIESASSLRTEEERNQRRYTPARPVYVNTDDNRSRGSYTTVRTTASESSSSASEHRSGSTVTGSTHYYPVSTNTRNTLQSQNQQQGSSSQSQYQTTGGSQSQHQVNSGSQSQYQGGSGIMRTGYGGYIRPGAASSTSTQQHEAGSNSHLSSRFGTGVLSTNSDDLLQYMSESERLARLQQQQIAGSSSRNYHSLSSVDEANRRTVNAAQHLDAAAADFVSSANSANSLANRNSEYDTVETFPGSGTFKRVKSWSKQSKWASGSEYDSDGKIKSHSMLSTAEAEKHNLNGAETGYKAATTTLENDGKVSTYSIHTP